MLWILQCYSDGVWKIVEAKLPNCPDSTFIVIDEEDGVLREDWLMEYVNMNATDRLNFRWVEIPRGLLRGEAT